jgi:ABC-2 type transport system permease protein
MHELYSQLRREFQKLFARRQTVLSFAAFLVFELLLLALLQHGAVREEVRRSILRAGFTFPENFTGPTIAFFLMSNTHTVLANLQVALVAGEIISKEIEDGTMRMLLCRPIRRGRVIAVKLLAALIFTCLVSGFINLTSLALGLLVQGPGYWLILLPKENLVAHHEFWPGMARYFIGTAFMTISGCSVTALAFMLSCLNMKPAAAAIVALSAFIVDDTIRNLPFFAGVKDWFVMTHIVSWLHVFDKRIPWGDLVRSYSFLITLNVILVMIGWLAFQRRDLKP